MNALELNGISLAYDAGTDVLADVSLTVKPGDVIGLLGRNGAGKTTLLRLALGMLEPRTGTVRVFGLDPREEPVVVKSRIGFVSEEQILPPAMRVQQVIAMHRGLYDMWDDDLADDLMRRFDISPVPKIGTLSKGQARRVALVCAVAHRPELLLLDEPASGLDPAARREFLETAIRLLNETGCSIVFSSHHMTDVERLADRIVMLHDGRVLLDNELDELRESFSLAVLPRGATASPDRLRTIEGCVGVRERDDGLRMILRLQPADARHLLERELGIERPHCQVLALEDMFVELAEGRS